MIMNNKEIMIRNSMADYLTFVATTYGKVLL